MSGFRRLKPAYLVVAGIITGVGLAVVVSRLAAFGQPASPVAAKRAGRTDAVQGEAEERAHAAAYYANLLREHLAEPIDHAWADAATATFEAESNALASAGHFEVLDVECRSKSCTATFRWPSYPSLVKGRESLLKARYALNCGVWIYAPPPADPSASYETRVMFPTCEGRE